MPACAWILETGELLAVENDPGGGFALTLPGCLPDDNILAIGIE